MLFEKGVFRGFIEQVEVKLEKSSEDLGVIVGISGRTLRDWKREKYNPSKEIIIKLSELAKVSIPDHKILPRYWYVKKAASLGGKKRRALYGLLGSKESRMKGGINSWVARKSNPELWKMYVKPIRKARESHDLAEFFGIMLGDGGLTHFQCVVYLNSETDQDFAYFVKGLVKELFNLDAQIYASGSEKVWRVSISSVDLVKYLTHKGLSVGNKVHLQVDVPLWIKSRSVYIKACLRGLIDTDGCFVLHKYKVNGKQYVYPKIAFTNRSMPLLNFVYEALKNLGYTPKRSYKYQIWLHNQQEVLRYLEEVGTRNYKPAIKVILEGGPDGKAQVC